MNEVRKRVCTAIFLLLAVWITSIATRRGPISFPVPDRNAYPEFLRAAALVDTLGLDYSKRGSIERVVSRSREAYPIVISALAQPCFVPVEGSQKWQGRHADDVGRLKALTHAMIARAKSAQFANDTEAAFEAYTDAFRFADAIGRGGLALDFLNSISCRALVLHHCKSLLPSITYDQRRKLIELLERSAVEREAPAAVAKRTRQWQREIFGTRDWLKTWWPVVREAWQKRSFRPFTSLRTILAKKEAAYELQYESAIYDTLLLRKDQ